MNQLLGSAFPEWFAAWYTFASAVPFLPSLFASVVWAIKSKKYESRQMKQRLISMVVALGTTMVLPSGTVAQGGGFGPQQYDFGDSWEHEVLFEGCLSPHLWDAVSLIVEFRIRPLI